jgi:hypothetical protein
MTKENSEGGMGIKRLVTIDNFAVIFRLFPDLLLAFIQNSAQFAY